MGGGAQLPLAMVREGEEAEVSRVRGSSEVRQHLAELGFVEGAGVRVVSRSGSGVIVSVKGATLALDRAMAMRVTTC